MTHRNPPTRIRWDDAFDAWGVTSTTAPNDVILTCNWADAIELANNFFMALNEVTITIHPTPDGRQKVYSLERTHA